jgi:hypothetical protein
MHYNSFMMRMNSARRKLLPDNWARVEDYILSLTLIDHMYNASNWRSLDIVRLRVGLLFHRAEYELTETEAEELVRRASMVQNDEWQRLYFLIKGHHYVASAQFCMISSLWQG